MESGAFLLVCNKIESWKQKSLTQIEVPNLACTVDQLASVVVNSLNLEKNTFDMICFGRTLQCSRSLQSYDISNGTIIYLLKKKTEESHFAEPHAPSSQYISPDGTLSMQSIGICISLNCSLLNPWFRRVLQGFLDYEKRECLIAVSPELADDPTLFGILSDEELLSRYAKRNIIKSVLKRYPNFLDVVLHILHEKWSLAEPPAAQVVQPVARASRSDGATNSAPACSRNINLQTN